MNKTDIKQWWDNFRIAVGWKKKPVVVVPPVDPVEPPVDPPVTPPVVTGDMSLGYGAVNFWHEISASVQAACGAGRVHIELTGWAESRGKPEILIPLYNALLAECRKRKAELFVSVFNDNSHLAKYGNTPWKPTVNQLLTYLGIVIAGGPDGVHIQPVGETQTENGKSFEAEAHKRLTKAGFRTCYNGAKGRPSGVPAGWTTAAWHPFKVTDRPPQGMICVTDTSTILNELGGYEKFDPAKVAAYTRTVRGWGNDLVLYGFLHKSVDQAAVNAMLSASAQPVPEPVGDYKITKVDSNNVYWTGPDLPWPIVAALSEDELKVIAENLKLSEDEVVFGEGGCCGESHLYRANGEGGKFDHVRPNTKSRDFKNIPSYGVFKTVGEPEKNETCELRLVKYGGKESVTVGYFKWPR